MNFKNLFKYIKNYIEYKFYGNIINHNVTKHPYIFNCNNDIKEWIIGKYLKTDFKNGNFIFLNQYKKEFKISFEDFNNKIYNIKECKNLKNFDEYIEALENLKNIFKSNIEAQFDVPVKGGAIKLFLKKYKPNNYRDSFNIPVYLDSEFSNKYSIKMDFTIFYYAKIKNY